MTRAEIDAKIAELKQEIEGLERQREHACPFKLPVIETFSSHWIVEEEATLTEICWMVRPNARQDAKYIAQAINTYPAYEALRAYWDKARPCEFFTMPTEVASLWHAANDAIEAVDSRNA